MAERTCLRCGTSIDTKSIKAKYCSETCKHRTYRSSRPKTMANCLECGDEFIVRFGARRCSPKCRAKRPSQNHRKPRPLRHLACPFCGAEFSTMNPRKRFCSPPCCHREHNRLMIERRGREEPYKPRYPAARDLLGKKCCTCGEYRLYEEFQKRAASADGLFAQCADCRRIRWKSARYNIPAEEVRRLESVIQCELCGGAVDFRDGSHAIDHCHDTHLVRGILCRACNVGIGGLQDSTELAMRAAEYLLRNVDVLAMAGQLTGREAI
jgi:hypothetical protein